MLPQVILVVCLGWWVASGSPTLPGYVVGGPSRPNTGTIPQTPGGGAPLAGGSRGSPEVNPNKSAPVGPGNNSNASSRGTTQRGVADYVTLGFDDYPTVGFDDYPIVEDPDKPSSGPALPSPGPSPLAKLFKAAAQQPSLKEMSLKSFLKKTEKIDRKLYEREQRVLKKREEKAKQREEHHQEKVRRREKKQRKVHKMDERTAKQLEARSNLLRMILEKQRLYWQSAASVPGAAKTSDALRSPNAVTHIT